MRYAAIQHHIKRGMTAEALMNSFFCLYFAVTCFFEQQTRCLALLPGLTILQNHNRLAPPSSRLSFEPPNDVPSKFLTRIRQQNSAEELWEAGDVYEDLNLLEQAIMLANAEQDLQHKERLETLEYFAKQRRPIQDDFRKYIVGPLSFSMVLVGLLKSKIRGMSTFHRFLDACSSLHTWVVIVLPAIVFLAVYKAYHVSLSPSESLPPDLEGLDPEYYRFVTDWEDPSKSTKDHVLCLIEQWFSAVAGFSLFAHFLPSATRIPSRIVLRLAAWASLHQYPKLWFQLQRRQQPRPLAWSVWTLQNVVKLQATPWLIATDLALFVAMLSAPSVIWLTGFGIIASTLVLLDHFPAVIPKIAKFRKPIQAAALLLLLIIWCLSHVDMINHALLRLKSCSFRGILSSMVNPHVILATIPRRRLRQVLAVLGALVTPLLHIRAIQRLFEFVYMHDLPLTLDPEIFREKSQDKSLWQWRYKLRWREPQRIHVTWEEGKRQFFYWLLFAGSVEDKLQKEMLHRQRNEVKRRGQSIWQRLAKDRLQNEPKPDRTQWKLNAMNLLAKEHKSDLEKKDYRDPLGAAVYSTLGIGLGFKFEHMSELDENEAPTARRLQARAAKSAIRRVQEIRDPKAAKEELDAIADPKERNQRAKEMRQESEREIQYLANRLTELIPTDLSLDSNKTVLFQELDPSFYERTSSHEYVLRTPASSSLTIDNLIQQAKSTIKDDEIDYLNPSGKTATENDDEFIKEWEKQSNKTMNTEKGNDEQDDEVKTVLA